MADDGARAEAERRAISARARGDWEGEREALDALIVLERALASRTPVVADGEAMAAARKILKWGADEARERDAMWKEASRIGVENDLDDAAVEALSERIEKAVDLLAAAPVVPDVDTIPAPGVDSPRRDALASEMRRALDEDMQYDDDDWTRLADAALTWVTALLRGEQ